MFGLGGPEMGFLALVPLLFWALVLAALYWAVRTGVRHGLLDADRRQPPPGPPPGTSGTPSRGGD